MGNCFPFYCPLLFKLSTVNLLTHQGEGASLLLGRLVAQKVSNLNKSEK
jgi:hypothetical protein